MKLLKYMKVLFLTGIISLSIMTPVYSSGNINISDSIVLIDINDFNWDWEYEPNFRTMQILDVITYSNEHAAGESMADYRPTHLANALDNTLEFKLADIKEKLLFNEDTKPRDPVTVKDGNGEYGSKLKYLIENNIVSRDSVYFINRKSSTIFKDDNAYTNQKERSKKYQNEKIIKDGTDLEYNDRSVATNKVDSNDIKKIKDELKNPEKYIKDKNKKNNDKEAE